MNGTAWYRIAGRALAALVLSWMLVSGPAHAQDEEVALVIDFTGEVDGYDGLAEQLAAAMNETISATGTRVSPAPVEDVLTLAGCADTSDECMRQALTVFEAQYIVLGRVEAGPDGKPVAVVRVVPAEGEPREQSVPLAATTSEEAASEFRGQAEAVWRGEPVAVLEPEPIEQPTEEPVTAFPGPEGKSFRFGRVANYSWAIAGGGAGLLILGGVMLGVASGKQGDVDNAPTETREDLEALVELEDSGRRYARFGSAFAVIGGAALVTGGVLIFLQGRDASRDEPDMTVEPLVPEDDGLGATWGVQLRGRW